MNRKWLEINNHSFNMFEPKNKITQWDYKRNEDLLTRQGTVLRLTSKTYLLITYYTL